MMAETRVIPSGEVYRQMFEAQVQLSLSLHDGRSKRAATEAFLKHDFQEGQEVHPGVLRTGVDTECSMWSEDTPTRAQTLSGGMKITKNHQLIKEISGLPDDVDSDFKGSDIIERLQKKKLKDHTEAVNQMHQDLAVISTKYEHSIKEQAEKILCHLSEYDVTVERLMKKLDSDTDLKKFGIQDLHRFWNSVAQEAANRRKWIKKLDGNFEKIISERTAVISTVLRKYTQSLEKFSYVLPCDVHRLMDSEAMMINQAVLSNRRAVGKLILNLMEDDLQKEALSRLRWEDKLKDWKRIKVLDAVNRFKDFINGPDVKCSKDILTTLDTLHQSQVQYSEERVTVLQAIKTLTPPNCSKSLITVWYSNLSAVNEKIDSMHIDTLKKMQSHYENLWQNCLAEVENFKDEVHTYGLPVEEIEDVVDTELLSLIGKCQKQEEERLEVLDKSFEYLAKQAASLSKLLFKFMQAASHLWELHTGGLQQREQHLQDLLDELHRTFKQEHSKKETQLEMLLDKLRQESSEEALKATLDRINSFLGEVKHGYITFHKEEVEIVAGYPATILEELQIYSVALCKLFSVKEFNLQVSDELRAHHPTLQLDFGDKTIIKRKKQIQGKKRLFGGVSSGSPNQINSSNSQSPEQEDVDCPQVFCDSHSQESFSSAKGNVYSAVRFALPCAQEDQEPNIPEVDLVKFPTNLLTELLQDVRVAFFNHHEEWYNSVLMNTVKVKSAKKMELDAEHTLRLHLHLPRSKRIELDVHNVRAAELVFHRDHMEKHSKAVLHSLASYRNDFNDFQHQQHKLTTDFRMRILGMEDVFNLATKSDVLVSLSGTLQSNLEKHINSIQASQRHFRQKLEHKLDDLRGSNAKLMKSIRLFSEGGNFTAKEIEHHQRRLEKVAKRIDAAEEAICLDMESIEVKNLDQAKDIIVRFEEKFQYLAVDLKFLEKIQGILTNTQVQIKTEVTSSNMQKKRIDNLLNDLEVMAQACSSLSPDKQTVTLEEILTFTTTLMADLRTRCVYMDCFLDPSMVALVQDPPLQGPYALAARHREERGNDSAVLDGLLHPSTIGVSFMDDVAVGVVKGLLRLSKPAIPDSQMESPDRVSAAVAVSGPSPAAQRRSHSGLENLRRRSQESVSVQSGKRFSKPTRLDKRFQVFGSKPVEQSVPSFKGIVTNILWKANDSLLLIAEEFYKKKERRAITRPQYLQETFEQCADEMNKRLLQYKSQTLDYHNNCLQELRQQLQDCEESLSRLPVELISGLTDQSLQDLDKAMDLERQKFADTLKESEEKKRGLRKQLTVRLSHPACAMELRRLKQEEELRQKEHGSAISNCTLHIKDCLRNHGEKFVTALAILTESLLFQMDELLITEDVLGGKAELKDNQTTGMIMEDDCTIEKDKRIWHGLDYFEPADGSCKDKSNRQTASITTAKTTMVHLQAIQARDAAYQRYLERYQEELAKVESEREDQAAKLLRWQEHWTEQLQTIARMNSE